MKFNEEVAYVPMDVVNPFTGETQSIEGRVVKTNVHYSIQKLNTKVDIMTLLQAVQLIGNSSKDTHIIERLIDKADDKNIIHINIAKYARDILVSRSQLNLIIKRSIERNLLHKIETGVYMLNPFIVISKSIRSSNGIETAQKKYREIAVSTGLIHS